MQLWCPQLPQDPGRVCPWTGQPLVWRVQQQGGGGWGHGTGVAPPGPGHPRVWGVPGPVQASGLVLEADDFQDPRQGGRLQVVHQDGQDSQLFRLP